MSLTRAFERRARVQASSKPTKSQTSTTRASSVSKDMATGESASSGGTRKPRCFKFLTLAEMANHRTKGLCYNCVEKFTSDHKCKKLFHLVLDFPEDGGRYEEDDDELEISLHALAGICHNESMRLSVTIGGHQFYALVDSGSTHNFISEEVAALAGLSPWPRLGLSAAVANGDRVPSRGVCRCVDTSIGEEDFRVDLFIIALGERDVVLGLQWLRTLGPILWDFDRMTLTFWRCDNQVTWTGLEGRRPHHSLRACSTLLLMEALLDEF